MRQKLAMPGEEDFGRLIESNAYYVDKTWFLRPLLTKTGNASIFTRPRRLGKREAAEPLQLIAVMEDQGFANGSWAITR